MRLQQSHCVVSEVIKYPNNVHNFLKHNAFNESDKKEITNTTLGGILSDINYSWLCNGPRLEVISTKNGVKIAAWTFGEVVKDYYTKVTCVVDLPSANSKKPVLVVGLLSGGTRGMICIFDTQTCRILRAVQVDKPVTSIHVINGGRESSLPGALRDLDGILAIGTEEGRIYIVDICRQSYEDTLNASNRQQIRDETNPSYLIPLSLSDIPMLERHREQALKTGDHICIQLNEFCTENEFILKGPRGETRLRANIVEVKISALHYCHQLGSLLVGFNFGAFQLYNLISVKLEYSSPAYEDCIPVTHFAFQEPSDDPRAFCYIWVMYSNIEHLPGFPLAVMYSLSYANKEYLEDYGYLYQELTACSIRFQTELKSLPSSNIQKPFGANCISLNAYTKGVQKYTAGITSDVLEDHLALCTVVWCVFNAHEVEVFLCLFDLNQWYKEQMPGSPNVEDNGSYMVFASLSELFHNLSTKSVLLDAKIDPKSITQFTATQRLEEHYYPSALSFSLICFREDDIIKITSTGIQRYLLSLIRNAGPLCLSRPTEIFQQCIKLGLTPFNSEVSYNSETSLKCQREMILSVALEHQLYSFLCQCARDWSNGSQSVGGCTLEFLINWAWQRTTSLKSTINDLCAPLFDYSGLRLDSNALIILNDCARQLAHLTKLYEYILNRCTQFLMDLRREEVEIQFNALKMISTYIEVLQWLLNVGLLPECPIYMYPRSDECERISAPYPVESLVRFYKNRRQELLELQGILNVEENQSCDLLFIDNLIKTECGGELLQNDWKNDGGTGLYPPPSLQALLRTYLIENVDIVHKHCIFIYVFLDLAMTLDQSRYTPIITHLIKFPAVFKLDASIIKITQAFWQLDHGDFSTAMAQLLDPLISNEVLQPWHHRIAVKALLAQGQHQHALLYHQVRKPPMTNVQDLLIAITVLIVNDLLKEAFHFQRQNRRVCNEKEILFHFIEACDKTNKLSQVIQLPLDEMEEFALIKYLQQNRRDETDTYLVQYYLQRSCFREAFENNENINGTGFEKQGLVGQIELNSRNSLIQRYKGSLPSVTQDLLKYCSTQKSNFQHNVCNILERPSPMSVSVHTSNDKLKYKSSLMQASLETAKDTWTNINKKSVELPFISTPKKVEKERKSLPVIVPTLIEGTITENDEENEGPTPHKRQRLSPRQSIKGTKKISAKSLLNLTPIIKRKTVPLKKISAAKILDNHPGSPQSILKVRKLVKKSTSPVDRGNSTTPEILENDSDYQPFEDLTKETIKNPLFDLSDYEINTPKNKSLVSARKSFRKSKTPSVHFEDSRASISSEGSQENMEIDTVTPNKTQEKVIPITLDEKTPNMLTSSPRKRKLSDSIQSRRSYKDDSILNDTGNITDILDSSEAASDISKGETSKTQFPKISGRKSLTRKVLEHNTLSKILPSPRRQTRSSNKINALPENVVGVEITHTETIKSYVKETYVNKIEEKSNKNILETKNTYSTKTDPNTSSQIIKHDHNESYTKSSTKLTEFLEDSESDVSSIDPILAQGSDVDESFLIKYVKDKSTNNYSSLYDSITKKEFEDTQEDIIQDIVPEENEDIIELQSLDNKDTTETTEEYVTLEESEKFEDTTEKPIETQENVVVNVEAVETQPFEITDDLTDEDVSFTIHSTMNVEVDPTKTMEIKDMEPENYIEPNFEEEVRNVLAEDLEYDEQMNKAEEEGMLDDQILTEIAQQQEEIADSQKIEVIEISEVETIQPTGDSDEEKISDQEESSEEEPVVISDDDEDKSEATGSSNSSNVEENKILSDSSNASEQEEIEEIEVEIEEIEEEYEESEEKTSVEEKTSNQSSESGENLNKNIIEVHSSSEEEMLLQIDEEIENEEQESSTVNQFEKNITVSNIPDSMNNTEAQIDSQIMESEDIITEKSTSELKSDENEEEKVSEIIKIDDPIVETEQNEEISEVQNINIIESVTESLENEKTVLENVPQQMIEKDQKMDEPSTSKESLVSDKPKRTTRASSLAPEVPKENIRKTRGRSVDIEMMSTSTKKSDEIVPKTEEKAPGRPGLRTRKPSIQEEPNELKKETSAPEKDTTTDSTVPINTIEETVKENKETIKEIPKKRGRKPSQNITIVEEKETIPEEVSSNKTVDKEEVRTSEEKEKKETVKVIPKKRGRPPSVVGTEIPAKEKEDTIPEETLEDSVDKEKKEEIYIPKKSGRKPSQQEIEAPTTEIVDKKEVPLRRGRKPSQETEVPEKQKELEIPENTTETVEKKEVSMNLKRGRKPSQDIEVPVKETDSDISENIPEMVTKEKKNESSTRRGRKPSVEVEDNTEVLTPARRVTRRTSLQLVEPIVEEREEVSTPTKRVGRRRTSIQSEQDDTKPSTPRRTRRNSDQSEDVNITLTPSRRGRKPSVQSEDIKLTPSRRTRASSILSDDKSPTKSGSESVSSKKEKLEQYAATHRLTRRQKIMMTEKGLPMGNIDPLALLDKETFAGEPDMEEQYHKQYSPTSSVCTESSVGTRSSARIQSKRTTPDKAHSDTLSLPSTPIRRTRASSKTMESPVQKPDQIMDENEPSTSTGRVKRKTTAQQSVAAPIVKRQRRLSQESKGSATSELAVKLQRLEDVEIERLRHRSLSPSLLIKESEIDSPRNKLKKKGRPSVLAKTELSKIAEEGITDESKNVSKNEEEEKQVRRTRPKRNLNC